MPQDGSNNYQYPPGTPGIPDTTIESEAYNTFLDDLVINDLNIPRPVHRGGTGASTADAALVNLKAEKAEQVVTAYLSHVWMPGSFRSAISATDPPVAGHAFAGICYINEPLVYPPTNANVTVEARDQSDTVVPGQKYIRQKIAGVWGAWVYEDQDVIDKAAGLETLAYNGMQINGSMEVSQERGVSNTIIGANSYGLDGWVMQYSGTMSCGLAQALVANLTPPTVVPGFKYALWMNTGTPQLTLGAGSFACVSQPIEGWRVARLGWGTSSAQSITLAFWTAHHRIGLYTGVVRNSANNRSYAFSYTQAVADIAQYNTVTIPGDTTGTWLTDNGVGLTVLFAMACGTTYTAPSLNTWLSGSYVAGPGQVNNVASAGDYMTITGFVVLPGTQAPTAAQSSNIMRPYDQELLTCKRYWQKLGGTAYQDLAIQGYCTAGGVIATTVGHPEMRSVPTAIIAGSWTASNVASFGVQPGARSTEVYITTSSSAPAYFFTADATTYISLNARL